MDDLSSSLQSGDNSNGSGNGNVASYFANDSLASNNDEPSLAIQSSFSSSHSSALAPDNPVPSSSAPSPFMRDVVDRQFPPSDMSSSYINGSASHGMPHDGPSSSYNSSVPAVDGNPNYGSTMAPSVSQSSHASSMGVSSQNQPFQQQSQRPPSYPPTGVVPLASGVAPPASVASSQPTTIPQNMTVSVMLNGVKTTYRLPAGATLPPGVTPEMYVQAALKQRAAQEQRKLLQAQAAQAGRPLASPANYAPVPGQPVAAPPAGQPSSSAGMPPQQSLSLPPPAAGGAVPASPSGTPPMSSPSSGNGSVAPSPTASSSPAAPSPLSNGTPSPSSSSGTAAPSSAGAPLVQPPGSVPPGQQMQFRIGTFKGPDGRERRIFVDMQNRPLPPNLQQIAMAQFQLARQKHLAAQAAAQAAAGGTPPVAATAVGPDGTPAASPLRASYGSVHSQQQQHQQAQIAAARAAGHQVVIGSDGQPRIVNPNSSGGRAYAAQQQQLQQQQQQAAALAAGRPNGVMVPGGANIFRGRAAMALSGAAPSPTPRGLVPSGYNPHAQVPSSSGVDEVDAVDAAPTGSSGHYSRHHSSSHHHGQPSAGDQAAAARYAAARRSRPPTAQAQPVAAAAPGFDAADYENDGRRTSGRSRKAKPKYTDDGSGEDGVDGNDGGNNNNNHSAKPKRGAARRGKGGKKDDSDYEDAGEDGSDDDYGPRRRTASTRARAPSRRAAPSRGGAGRDADPEDDEWAAREVAAAVPTRATRARGTRKVYKEASSDEEDNPDDIIVKKPAFVPSSNSSSASVAASSSAAASSSSSSSKEAVKQEDNDGAEKNDNGDTAESQDNDTSATAAPMDDDEEDSAWAIEKVVDQRTRRNGVSLIKEEDKVVKPEPVYVATDPFDMSTPSVSGAHIPTPIKIEPRASPTPEEEWQEGDETEYLIKWQDESYMHTTWHTERELVAWRVKGLKRLGNYQKKRFEEDVNRRSASAEDIEQWLIFNEMNRDNRLSWSKVDRVIAMREMPSSDAYRIRISRRQRLEGPSAELMGETELVTVPRPKLELPPIRQNSADVEPQYLVKWMGLPYEDCTWEFSDDLTRYQSKVDDFLERDTKQWKVETWGRGKPRKFRRLEQPDYLRGGELRDYQQQGLNWLVSRWCENTNGILADEMGLGKTIQTISLLAHLMMERSMPGPFLVVAPLSTIPAWQRELEKWAPFMHAVVYVGNAKSREMIRTYEWESDTRGPKRFKFEVLITTYEFAHRDREFLQAINWNYLMVDEAHRLKDNKSLLYEVLNSFRTASRLLITGTPLQNTVKELWCLLHFLDSQKFPDLDQFDAEYGGVNRGDNIGRLHQVLQPHLLRRTKKDVLKSLPAKTERILRVEMTSIQKKYYRWVVTRNYHELNKGVKGKKQSLSNIIVEMKKATNHPWLFPAAHNMDMSAYELKSEREKEKEEKERKASTGGSGMNPRLELLIKSSGKVMLLDKLLIRLKETGHRVLIFSQMVKMLDVLAEYMRLRGFQHQRLDGAMRSQDRQTAMDHFNAPGSPDFCFLLSTRAGGLGINLATADTVIIFDSDWNPQNDLQAEARAHRIGQKNTVNIYRLVTRGTVEESILERAKQKLILDHMIIQRMDTSGRTTTTKKNKVTLSSDELAKILQFGAAELFSDKPVGDGPAVVVDGLPNQRRTPSLIDGVDGVDGAPPMGADGLPLVTPAPAAAASSSSSERKDKTIDEMDLDEILSRDVAAPAPSTGEDGKDNATEQFLSAFKIATFATTSTPDEEDGEGDEDDNLDELGEEKKPKKKRGKKGAAASSSLDDGGGEWAKIIPKGLVPTIIEEEFDSNLVLTHPRKRKQIYGSLDEDIDEGSVEDYSKKTYGALGAKDARKVHRALMHWGDVPRALAQAYEDEDDDPSSSTAASDSKKKPKKKKAPRGVTLDERKVFATDLVAACRLAVERSKEGKTEKKEGDEKKRKSRAAAMVTFCDVPLNATDLVSRMSEMKALQRTIDAWPSGTPFRLKGLPLPTVRWPKEQFNIWGLPQDSMLMQGVQQYGMNAMDQIVDDTQWELKKALMVKGKVPDKDKDSNDKSTWVESSIRLIKNPQLQARASVVMRALVKQVFELDMKRGGPPVTPKAPSSTSSTSGSGKETSLSSSNGKSEATPSRSRSKSAAAIAAAAVAAASKGSVTGKRKSRAKFAKPTADDDEDDEEEEEEAPSPPPKSRKRTSTSKAAAATASRSRRKTAAATKASDDDDDDDDNDDDEATTPVNETKKKPAPATARQKAAAAKAEKAAAEAAAAASLEDGESAEAESPVVAPSKSKVPRKASAKKKAVAASAASEAVTVTETKDNKRRRGTMNSKSAAATEADEDTPLADDKTKRRKTETAADKKKAAATAATVTSAEKKGKAGKAPTKKEKAAAEKAAAAAIAAVAMDGKDDTNGSSSGGSSDGKSKKKGEVLDASLSSRIEQEFRSNAATQLDGFIEATTAKNYPALPQLIGELGGLVEGLAAASGIDAIKYWTYLGSLSEKTGERVRIFYEQFCLKAAEAAAAAGSDASTPVPASPAST